MLAMAHKDKQVSGEDLREILSLYSTGDFNTIRLSDKSKKDRRLFCAGLEEFFNLNEWIFNEQTARKWLESKQTKKDGSKAKLSSQNRYIAQMRAFNNFCIQRGVTTINFCKWLAKAPESLTIKEIPDLSDEIVFKAMKLGTTPGKGDMKRSAFIKQESYDAMMFYRFTSRRSGEMKSLKGKDIHTEASDPYYEVTLKGGKRKKFPIPNNLIDMLSLRQKNKRAFKVTPETTIKHFRDGLRLCGVAEEIVMQCNNHTFRKLFAREKYRNGEDISKIADAMADTIPTVKKYYLGEDMEAIKKTVNNSKFIKGGVPISDLMDEAMDYLKVKFEDSRFEMGRIKIDEKKILFELNLTKEGIEELRKII